MGNGVHVHDMKISKLYIRNFITVMAIIIMAQVSIAALFRYVGRTAGNRNFRSDISGMAFMVNETVKENYNPAGRSRFEKVMADLAKAWSTDIWVDDSEGKPIFSSSATSRPEFSPDMELLGQQEGYRVYRNYGGPPTILLRIESSAGPVIYVRREPRAPYIEDLNFLAGLAVITFVVALVLLPVSRRITKPLKRLTESADAIAHGRFDMRVDESAHDEIGELARAFNLMSGRVLQMINGTRDLTANISHQVRSPLARISVAAGILRDQVADGDSSGAEKNISFIEQEIGEMDSLTGRIIELLRVDSLHIKEEYTSIDLQQVAADTAARFSSMFGRNSIAYNAEITSIPCIISGVARDIRELFDILYDNALKYTPDGGTVNTEMHPEKDGISLTVSNTIPESAPMDTSVLFEPFKRVAPENIPGNGLGLAIARRIAINHGGTISATHAGSRFTVSIKFPSQGHSA